MGGCGQIRHLPVLGPCVTAGLFILHIQFDKLILLIYFKNRRTYYKKITVWDSGKENAMKWPSSVMLIRHDVSEYNTLRNKKKTDPIYQNFLESWKVDPNSDQTKALALTIQKKWSLGVGDANTRLEDSEGKRAYKTGKNLSKCSEVPDIVFVSPYARTWATFEALKKGWQQLKNVKVIEEERIREQEHGLSLLYNDWKVFHALNPEQRELFNLEGSYWYRYPQGENVPDVRARIRSFMSTLTRDWAKKKVLLVTHHLAILAFRAHMERLSSHEFIALDRNAKPMNCGVTLYRGHSGLGENGRLVLEYYNKKFF